MQFILKWITSQWHQIGQRKLIQRIPNAFRLKNPRVWRRLIDGVSGIKGPEHKNIRGKSVATKLVAGSGYMCMNH